MSNEEWNELDESYRSALSGALETAHPAVEQAGGERRDALQSIMEWTAAENIPDDRKLCLIRNAARAALAQPSPAHAEQAEAERPEVVAYFDRNYPSTGDAFIWSNYEGSPYEPVMTVSQHERIVEARWNRAMDLMGEHVARISEKFKAERDAALARVEQQERTIAGMNEAHAKLAGLYEAAQAQHSVPAAWYYDAPSQAEAAIIDIRGMWGEDDCPTYEDVASALRRLLAAAPGKEVPQAWLDVQAERRRQIEAKGWTPEHDDLYCSAELPRAAAAYTLNGANDEAPAIWPFVAKWWKPRDARSNYVRAGALILAEIERLDRAAPGKEVGHE
ncbi:hypothetical protein N0711_06425 [Pseudomonas aeruginosa]|nr:hypothetical protein [Pseudomonas aeruginosa]MCT0556746.1 hypothetical protein [Pseudomonas aeruginosa]